MKRLIFSIFVLFFIYGCSTSYQPVSFTGGFSETRLDENIFRVTFKGNGYTGRDKAADMCLLRSAELTLINGYSHFIIVGSREDTRHSTYTTPTRSTTNINATTYGNKVYGTANTTTHGGQTYHFSKPSATNTVVLFKGKPEVNGIVYNAEYISNSIGSKYGIDLKN